MIGTATGRWDRYIIVETPLPWKPNVVESACFSEQLAQRVKMAESANPGVRVQGVVPDSAYSRPGHKRLIHLTRPAGAFARFTKAEYLVPDGHLVSVLYALLESQRLSAHMEQYRQAETSARDLLVCTHGSRDACCGNLGVPIYTRLRYEYAEKSGGALRVWRTSHLGGHRFAPTLVDVPQMRYWGRVTPDLLDALVTRSGSAELVRPHYRGWAGLRTPFEQVAEREILTRFGWELACHPCAGSAEILDDEGTRARVRIAYSPIDGHVRADGHVRTGGHPQRVFEAEVVQRGRVMGIGSCGDEDETEFEQYTVRRLDEATS